MLISRNLVVSRKRKLETETLEPGTRRERKMKRGYNELKLRALAAFDGRGWLSPPAWAVLADYYPVRASYSYIRRHLWRWKLVDRSLDRRGLLLYRLSPKGEERLAWLRERALTKGRI